MRLIWAKEDTKSNAVEMRNLPKTNFYETINTCEKKGLKMIKKIFIFSIACLFACSASAIAQGRGNFSGRLNALRSQLIEGEIIAVEGSVISRGGGPRQTMVINTGEAPDDVLVSVFGIGPDSCWDTHGMSKPDVGDDVIVEYGEITLSNGSTKLRTISITTIGTAADGSNETIDVIDPLTGENLCKPTRGDYFGRLRDRLDRFIP